MLGGHLRRALPGVRRGVAAAPSTLRFSSSAVVPLVEFALQHKGDGFSKLQDVDVHSFVEDVSFLSGPFDRDDRATLLDALGNDRMQAWVSDLANNTHGTGSADPLSDTCAFSRAFCQVTLSGPLPAKGVLMQSPIREIVRQVVDSVLNAGLLEDSLNTGHLLGLRHLVLASHLLKLNSDPLIAAVDRAASQFLLSSASDMLESRQHASILLQQLSKCRFRAPLLCAALKQSVLVPELFEEDGCTLNVEDVAQLLEGFIYQHQCGFDCQDVFQAYARVVMHSQLLTDHSIQARTFAKLVVVSRAFSATEEQKILSLVAQAVSAPDFVRQLNPEEACIILAAFAQAKYPDFTVLGNYSVEMLDRQFLSDCTVGQLTRLRRSMAELLRTPEATDRRTRGDVWKFIDAVADEIDEHYVNDTACIREELSSSERLTHLMRSTLNVVGHNRQRRTMREHTAIGDAALLPCNAQASQWRPNTLSAFLFSFGFQGHVHAPLMQTYAPIVKDLCASQPHLFSSADIFKIWYAYEQLGFSGDDTLPEALFSLGHQKVMQSADQGSTANDLFPRVAELLYLCAMNDRLLHSGSTKLHDLLSSLVNNPHGKLDASSYLTNVSPIAGYYEFCLALQFVNDPVLLGLLSELDPSVVWSWKKAKYERERSFVAEQVTKTFLGVASTVEDVRVQHWNGFLGCLNRGHSVPQWKVGDSAFVSAGFFPQAQLVLDLAHHSGPTASLVDLKASVTSSSLDCPGGAVVLRRRLLEQLHGKAMRHTLIPFPVWAPVHANIGIIARIQGDRAAKIDRNISQAIKLRDAAQAASVSSSHASSVLLTDPESALHNVRAELMPNHNVSFETKVVANSMQGLQVNLGRTLEAINPWVTVRLMSGPCAGEVVRWKAGQWAHDSASA